MYMNKKRFALPERGLIPLGKRPVTQQSAPGLADDAGDVGFRAAHLRLEGLRSALMLQAPYFMLDST